MRILIVKTSSLGDIIQAFCVLKDLHRRFPTAQIDWAVEAPFSPIVAAHPRIDRAIPLHIKENRSFWKDLKALRERKYDLIFDLQGNCKSGLITWLARGKLKVGYSFRSVREWPNILATHLRFTVSREQNIRLYYLGLLEKTFQTVSDLDVEGVVFKVEPREQEKIAAILNQLPPSYKVMVCPGSKWVNKQLHPETLLSFLQKIEEAKSASFLLIWGDAEEKALCEQLKTHLRHSIVVDKLPLPTWQNLMAQVDLVLAVDSSALHLCGTTATPSFSIFGPTSPHVFKPIGPQHIAFQGTCPYGRTFVKQCPLLRSCPTGACIRHLSAADLFTHFLQTQGFGIK